MVRREEQFLNVHHLQRDVNLPFKPKIDDIYDFHNFKDIKKEQHRITDHKVANPKANKKANSWKKGSKPSALPKHVSSVGSATSLGPNDSGGSRQSKYVFGPYLLVVHHAASLR